MAAYVLKYHRTAKCLLDVVEFPEGAEAAAECNATRYAATAAAGVEVHVFRDASIRERVRAATPDELALNSEGAVRALMESSL